MTRFILYPWVAVLSISAMLGQDRNPMVRSGPSLQYRLGLLPASGPLRGSMGGGDLTPTTVQGQLVRHRSFHYGNDYAEYDLLLEPGPTLNEYFASILPSEGPLDSEPSPVPAAIRSARVHHALTKYPERQLMRSGDILAVEFALPSEGDLRVVEYVTLFIDPEMSLRQRSKLNQERMRASANQSLAEQGLPPILDRQPPPRDFSPENPDLVLFSPSVSVNGGREIDGYLERARGSLVWIYVPNHGRYILSLLPRPELGFSLAGDLQRDHMALTSGPDALEIDFATFPVPFETAYKVYLRHEADFRPMPTPQQNRLIVGAVSPAELASLKE